MTQGRIRRGAAVATATPAIDDLSVLLPDWRTHLRSRSVAPSTIASYLKVGDNLLVCLREALAAVSVVLAGSGSVPDVDRLARGWAARRPGTRVEGQPEPQGRESVQDRLEEIDRLLAAGAVTQQERDTQRSRVLGEL